jgi:hypothetical protein
MNHFMQHVSSKLGASPQEQQLAARRAQRTKARLRPSARLMAAMNGAGNVLSVWRRDRRYRRSDGSPRVLPIRGKGATLESLVRKCVHQMTLEEVLAYICTHGEATLYKGDRVALLGGAAILTQRMPEVTLAWMLTQFRHLAETMLHNAAIPAGQVKGVAFFQRQVAGWLSDQDFRRYAKAVYPQFQALCNQLEEGLSLERRPKSQAQRKECGIGLFVYQDARSLG